MIKSYSIGKDLRDPSETSETSEESGEQCLESIEGGRSRKKSNTN